MTTEHLAADVEAEVWRPIPGFPDHEASSLGRVRALSRRVHNYMKPGKILTGTVKPSSRGKPVCVNYSLGRGTSPQKGHHLVLRAFVGERPEGLVGCHNDGNPLNNRIENLRWDTIASNVADSVKHRTNVAPPKHFGEEHPNSRLTWDHVFEIRNSTYRPGFYTEWGRKLGVSHQTIRRIYLGLLWTTHPDWQEVAA